MSEMPTAALPAPRAGDAFWRPLVDRRTYTGLLYLALAFPLGLTYFIVLVTGFSLGVGLLILGIGVLILAATLLGSTMAAIFERWLAITLLGARITPLQRDMPIGGDAMWPRLRVYLTDRATWTGLLFLLLKFPLGVATFTIMVTLVALTGGLLSVPFVYRIDSIRIAAPVTLASWTTMPITTLDQALVCAGVGVLVGIVSLYIFSGLTTLNRWLAETLLA